MRVPQRRLHVRLPRSLTTPRGALAGRILLKGDNITLLVRSAAGGLRRQWTAPPSLNTTHTNTHAHTHSPTFSRLRFTRALSLPQMNTQTKE